MKDELIYKIQNNDEESVRILLEKYRYLVIKIVNGFGVTRGDYRIDRDDLIQEGNIALYRAAMSYKDGTGASFITYAYKVIYCRLCRVVANMGKPYKYEGISLDGEQDIERTAYRSSKNPIDLIIYCDTVKMMENFMKNASPLERKIIALRQDRYTYKDIASILNITPKRVDYLIQKMKNRYRLKLEEEGLA